MPGFFFVYTRRAIGVASAAGGSFTVSWDLSGFSGTGGFLPMPFWSFQFGSYIRRYAQNGVALGPETQVNVHTDGAQREPSVGVAAAGTTLVAWTSVPESEGCFSQPPTLCSPNPPLPPQDGSGAGVYARLFDASGTDVGGGEFRVNATTAGDQSQPAVAMAGPARAIVVFVQPDGSGSGIFARVYGHALTPARLRGRPHRRAVLRRERGPGELGSRPRRAGVDQRDRNRAVPERHRVVLHGAAGADLPDRPTNRRVRGPAGRRDTSCLEVAHCPTVAVFGARPAVALGRSVHGDDLPGQPRRPEDARPPHRRQLCRRRRAPALSTASWRTFFHNGVMDGCASGWFCPFWSVPREEMALFVLKAAQPAFVPPACVAGAERFVDVPASSPYCRWIEELARRGVVGGCGGGNYCPQRVVSREALAVYLLVTREGTGYAPPACGTPLFVDVPAASAFCRWIEELARRGIVTGCGNGRYCPGSGVTREQMSVFLAVTFGLTLYAP